MVAALWVPMVRALKSPTGFFRWGLLGEVSLVVGVAPVPMSLVFVVFGDGGAGGLFIDDGLA